jgi:hypothetical protein
MILDQTLQLSWQCPRGGTNSYVQYYDQLTKTTLAFDKETFPVDQSDPSAAPTPPPPTSSALVQN